MSRYVKIVILIILCSTAGNCGLKYGWNTPVSVEFGYTIGKGTYLGLGLMVVEQIGTSKNYFKMHVTDTEYAWEYTSWQYRGISAAYNHYFKNRNTFKFNSFWGRKSYKKIAALFNVGLVTDLKSFKPLVKINLIGNMELGLGYEMIYSNQRFQKSYSSILLLGSMGGLFAGPNLSGGSMNLGI